MVGNFNSKTSIKFKLNPNIKRKPELFLDNVKQSKSLLFS